MTGVDAADNATAASEGKSYTDYTQFLDPAGLHGARIGVARKYFGFSEEVDALMAPLLEEMKKQRATLIDPADIETFGKFDESELAVLLYELKADLNAYLSRLPRDAQVHTLKDLIEFNEKNKQKEMPYFGQDLFIKAEAKGSLTNKVYLKAIENNRKMACDKGIDALMDKHKLDAIVAPTAGPACLTDLLNGDHFTGGSSNAAAVARYPNINVPAGFIHGMPVGISFFGRPWSEPTLIKLAYSFEQATKLRKPPQFLLTISLNTRA
jgi:amidase